MKREEAVAIVSDIRSRYNCFDVDEEPKYHALSMAIEALSDVPDTNVGKMEDLIKRSDAIEAIGEEPYVWDENDEYMKGQHLMWELNIKDILAVPSVKKCGKWIPVSERLPSNEQNLKGFLTTIKCYVENDVFIQVYENGKFGHWDGEKLIPNDDVIAWMEIPEPYMENES